MKKVYFLLSICGFWLWESDLLGAFIVEIDKNMEEKRWEYTYPPIKKGSKSSRNIPKKSIFYTISKGKGGKFVNLDTPINIDYDLEIKTELPVVFNTNIVCDNLTITYTDSHYDTVNNGDIQCQNLQLYHPNEYLFLYNNKKIKIKKGDIHNKLEIKRVKLDDYILVNNGDFYSNAGLEFTWGNENVPTEPLVYSPEKQEGLNYGEWPRIHNEGVIRSTYNIHLSVPVYIGEKGIIKTSRKSSIHYYSRAETYPIYAIIRVPKKELRSYIGQTLTSGQLGEDSAKHYYKNFETIPNENIGTFKVNNSDNGIDIMCIDNLDNFSIVHESKNLKNLKDEHNGSFKLSPSKIGLQCSKPWLENYFSKMLTTIEEDNKAIHSNSQNNLVGDDLLLLELLKQKKKDIDFYKEFLEEITYASKNNNIITLKQNLLENNLKLNGNSIYHVDTPLGKKTLPFYYCQRNIDTAFKVKFKKVKKKTRSQLRRNLIQNKFS